ncbi:kinase-like protein [Ramaria rubella]|nr:kinase-like protein [Ramaria rubella]
MAYKQGEHRHAHLSPLFFNIRLKLGPIVFPGSVGFRTIRTKRIGFHSFLKAGAHVDISEADAMRYVAERTSIPVPKVQRAWCSNGITYILMDFVDGIELSSAWHGMSQKTKRRVVDQLKRYLAELRDLQPPTNGAVASVTGGPLRDNSRVGLGKFGPFPSHHDFHQFLRANFTLDSFQAVEGSRPVIDPHRQSYADKFTHGDFAPRNVLVKKDGTVTAIIDWDSSGWFPKYWEYTKANFSPHAPDDWVSSIGEMTGRYDEQLAGERRLDTLCGSMLT